MKPIPLFLFFVFFLIFTGCGRLEEQNDSWQGIRRDTEDLSTVTDRTEYYDIAVSSRQFDSGASAGAFLGAQFYQGEPVELRTETLPDENNHYRDCLCIYRMDGSREILIPDLSRDTLGKCYLDQDGACYSWVNSHTIQYPGQEEQIINTALTKYLSSGEIQFVREWNYEEKISDVRQLPDGRVYLILEDSGAQKRKLLELDTDTGETAEISGAELFHMGIGGQYLGESGGSLALYKFSVYDERDFVKLNLKDGSQSFLLSLNGTSYMFPSDLALNDFQVLEDGSVEILWADEVKSAGILETLQMIPVEQAPVILRGNNFTSWMLEQVSLFNQSNDRYRIIPEPCVTGNDPDDFARLTSIQLSAGRGPDILYGDFMHDYLWGMLSRGILEDMSPYIENAGIRKEDYFSLVFSNWSDGGKIYGINVQFPYLTGYKTSEKLLGNLEDPDGEAIIDALLSQKDNLVYLRGYNSQALLNLFLSGSETLLGMVDWEKGSCDFGGLFQKLLEAAKRYGDDGRTHQDSYPTEEISFLNVFEFDSRFGLERAGMIQTGILFDDGCHAAVSSFSTLAVNANSSVKEGAWEFISFLLSREAQAKLDYLPPIQKDAFGLWIERERDKVSDGGTYIQSINYIEEDGSVTTVTKEYTEEDITEEKVEEYKKTLDDARPYPIRAIPVLEIIREEAEYYFNGSKTAEEVGTIVTNRVQLYLDENL